MRLDMSLCKHVMSAAIFVHILSTLYVLESCVHELLGLSTVSCELKYLVLKFDILLLYTNASG